MTRRTGKNKPSYSADESKNDKRKPKQILKQQKMLKNFGIRPMKPFNSSLKNGKLSFGTNTMVKLLIPLLDQIEEIFDIDISQIKSGFSKKVRYLSTLLESKYRHIYLGRVTLLWPVFMLPLGKPVSLPLTQPILGMFVRKWKKLKIHLCR